MNGRFRSAAALVAAYVIALQGIVSSFAAASMAGPRPALALCSGAAAPIEANAPEGVPDIHRADCALACCAPGAAPAAASAGEAAIFVAPTAHWSHPAQSEPPGRMPGLALARAPPQAA